MSPQAPGICHCQEGSDPAIPASGSEDGDRHDDIFSQGGSAAGRFATNKWQARLLTPLEQVQ